MDVSGDHQLDVLHSVYKQRLTMDGQPITEQEPEPIQMGPVEESQAANETEVVVDKAPVDACGR